MKTVTLTKLGTPGTSQSEITIPYNGDAFEFLAPEWVGIARRASGQDGPLREGDRIAEVKGETT